MKTRPPGRWSDGRGPVLFQLGLSTFGILALELALIRWTSGQVRILAYFNNLTLICCFLGMGLGLVVGRRRPELMHLTLPALFAIGLPFAFAPELGLVGLRFPDPSVYLWGAQSSVSGVAEVLQALGLILLLFGGIATVFFFAGTAVGHLFTRAPSIRGYSADLVGSLLGVLLMAVVAALGATPPVWLALGALPFAYLSGRLVSWTALVGLLVLGQVSVAGASFSPYNRIDIEKGQGTLTISVNRDFHQYMHDLSERAGSARNTRGVRMYDMPFILGDARDRALVVGAGTGNDVAAALRNGFKEVVSVDIDGRIIELGKRMHPERPYDDPRVVPVVNDARAFFDQYVGPPFDVVCYGFVDSHAMFSALTSLRLDNYLYTVEGIRAAWKHVAPQGHLTVALSLIGGSWLAERLYWTIAHGTGELPVMVDHGLYGGATFVAARPDAKIHQERLAPFPLKVVSKQGDTRTANDDWPFLYFRPDVVPWGYLLVLAAILLAAAGAARVAFGAALRTDFHLPLFLMGAAFLLIETRGVTSLSLLFGSTWVVNTVVFGGVLAVALAANLLVGRRQPTSMTVPFILLLGATALVWAVQASALSGLPLVARGMVGGVLNALPVGFAGIIVSTTLARARSMPAALGSNLLGSVVGGCLEYSSMYLGLRAVAALAFVLYLGAFLLIRRGERAPAASALSSRSLVVKL